ncbi:MAG: aspartate--tRNA ligase, partial [Candidatus Saccharimonadales bacterium]
MKYTPIKDTIDNIGKEVVVAGWCHSIRNMGKMAFIDLRDPSGLLQVVIASDELPKLGPEWVVEVKGEIKERGEKFVNPNVDTGSIELKATEIKVINQANELPIEIKKDTSGISEEVRLQYRYLDLRSDRMMSNMKLRHQSLQFIRNFLSDNDFLEVDTPMLTKGTPEGAREYIVPSRLHAGKFYVLPQSPQQFKQLLMVSGVGKYFQIAKCLRDEDQRGDRQPEFTQIDMEMSFVDRDEILSINESMIRGLIELVAPEKKISVDFEKLTYQEAMQKYGSDKPDLRKDPKDPNELAFVWIVDFPMFAEKDGKLEAMHHPFTAPLPEDEAKLGTDPKSVRADAYDLVLNGFEIAGGSMRISSSDLQHKVFELLQLKEDDITKRFGHILEAFSYGTPPHGGIAYGFDRLLMVLANEPNIREVIAFPKTGDGRDPLTGAPTELDDKILKEAN